MRSVILVDDCQENADKDVHTNHQKYHKEKNGPRIVVIRRHPIEDQKLY